MWVIKRCELGIIKCWSNLSIICIYLSNTYNIYVKYGHLDKNGVYFSNTWCSLYTIPLPQLSKMYPKFSNIYVKIPLPHLSKMYPKFSNIYLKYGHFGWKWGVFQQHTMYIQYPYHNFPKCIPNFLIFT
jgi:hypothetical protein